MADDFLSNLSSGGAGSASRFLTDWYGEPATPPGGTQAADDPLRHLHELAARWPEAIRQNRLLLPPESRDGRLVFYVENQGVFEWATEPAAAENARVWGREPDESAWAEEEPRLAAFVVELLVFEAIMGSTHGASVAWLAPERASEALGPLEPLRLGAWRWPDYPTTFYAGGARQLAVVTPNRVPGDSRESVTVMVAARDSEALAYLDSVVDESWEHFSRRELPAH